MNFISARYPLLLVFAATGYYLLPRKYNIKNIFLLACSYWFYMQAAPQYAVFLLFSTIVTYLCARAVCACSDKKKRKALHVAGVLLNLGVLFVFKYFDFFVSAIVSALSVFAAGGIAAPKLSLIAPLGISFYTFTTLGYQIDVYNGKLDAEKSFVNYALFASFFPQLLSGPIARASSMLPQYREGTRFDFRNIELGAGRFLTGLFKKAVIADWLLRYVDAVYASLEGRGGPSVALAVLLYAVAHYLDFSGYSDMAIGSGKLLGFELPENFASPLLATNISGLWARWHMSLTSWLQDYIFTPLVWSNWWNRAFHKKTLDSRPPEFIANIIIVFLISGLWHGAAWTFIVWGLWHGLLRVSEELLHRWRKRPKKLDSGALELLRHIGKSSLIFLAYAFGLIFFNADGFGEAAGIIKEMLAPGVFSEAMELWRGAAAAGSTASPLYFTALCVVLALSLLLILAFDIAVYSRKPGPLRCYPFEGMRSALAWACWFFMALASVSFGCFGSSSFIYFKF